MIYLLLAILSSTVISVFMRLGDRGIKNDMLMFTCNYFTCMLLSAYYMKDHIILQGGQGMKGIGFATLLGILSGALYLISFVLFHLNIGKNGMVLSSMFMRLGVLVPTLMAIVIFKEKAKFTQMTGFLLALCAIVIINGKKEETIKQKVSDKAWLLILLFISGLTDSLANVYDKRGVLDLKDHYLLFTFFMAFLLSAIFWRVKKQGFTVMDVFWGIVIGIPNYYSARFLLLALGKLPAVLVYPVYNVATILAISFCGFILFKEDMSKRKIAGLLMII